MFTRLMAITTLAASLTLASPVAAQHAGQATHAGTSAPGSGLPSEPGDATFAAIAEIVAMLSADETTDWSTVDIGALRLHLVDMNQLVIGARVRTERITDGVITRIDTAGPAGEAAVRMVPVHAPVLAAETGWNSQVSTEGNQLVWTVTGAPGSAQRIQALGFFGLMATGDHHRAHHIALARGENAH